MANEQNDSPEPRDQVGDDPGQGVPILPGVPFLSDQADGTASADPSREADGVDDADADAVMDVLDDTDAAHTTGTSDVAGVAGESEVAGAASGAAASGASEPTGMPGGDDGSGSAEEPRGSDDGASGSDASGSDGSDSVGDARGGDLPDGDALRDSDMGPGSTDRSDGIDLDSFAVPVAAVPPSVLQGPTISVQAPTDAALPGVASAPSSEPTSGIGETGWQPSGTRGSTTGSGAPGAAGGSKDARAASADRGGERSSRREKDTGPEPASALTADRLLAGVARPPASGWRRWVYRVTFGRVNMGDSDAVRVHRALEHRITVRLGERTRYVPVLSRKGGVGKTTVTTLLGMALADIREDRIIAMDANPDRGTLSDRSPGRAEFTARQLVQNRYSIESFAQLAAYVTRDGSRLHVLASDTDPAVAQAFDDADYRAVTDVLSRYYSVVLTDSGTGMVHSVMKGTLDKADSVVLVSGGSVDEARLASETLSWLEAHGRQDLLAKAIVVINLSSGNGTQVDVSQIEQHFRSRVNTVVRIPYDRHLAEGSRVELAKLNPATRRAVTELAALVVDQLAS